MVGTRGEPIVTTIKALMKPKPLDEIRDPREQFDMVDAVTAASGVKISAPDLEGVLAGAPLRAATGRVETVCEEIEAESQIDFHPDDVGVIVKADAIGSLEALLSELREHEMPVKKIDIGDISRRDIIEAATIPEPLCAVLLGFNVDMLPDAKEEIEIKESPAKVFQSDIIYKLIEDYEEWVEVTKAAMERDKRGEIVHPGKFQVLGDYIFRISKPAVFGIRVLAGRVRPGQKILRPDGRVVGEIASIRSGEDSLKEAEQGQEVAVAVPAVTVGRQVKAEDILYVEIPEGDAKKLNMLDYLTFDEEQVLDEVCTIKREEAPFWGM